MSTKSIMIGTLSIAVAFLTGNAAANAHGSSHGSMNSMKMHSEHEHSEHSFHHPHLRFIVRSNYDCSYYYERWMDTGSRYWKHKYFDCRD